MTSSKTATPIFCSDCGVTGSVGQVTATLRCRACGSGNLGLVGVDPRPSVVVAQRRQAAPKFDDPGGHHVQRYIDWAMTEGHNPDHTETLKRYEKLPGIGRAHTNHIADQLYIGGGDTDWRGPYNKTHDPDSKTAAGGTGWTGPDPRRFDGWNEYQGPTPQVAPRSAPVADSTVCPVCHGSKYDPIDKGPCRECGGTGYITHPTQRGPAESYDPGRPLPAGGAHLSSLGGFSAEAMARVGGRTSTDPFGSVEQHLRSTDPQYRSPAPPGAAFDPHNQASFYPKADHRSPMIDVRKDRDYSAPTGPYQMDQASCPSCGHAPTELCKDKNEDAWWHCPNCGPLANIDANPNVNPYSPPQGFQPDRSMKTGGFLSRNRKTGRLIQLLATIHQANDLNADEAVDLARKTLLHYGEGR